MESIFLSGFLAGCGLSLFAFALDMKARLPLKQGEWLRVRDLNKDDEHGTENAILHRFTKDGLPVWEDQIPIKPLLSA